MTWKSLLPLLLLSCKPLSEADLEGTRGGRVDVMFNEPAPAELHMWEPDAVRLMIETIRDARSSIDMAVMGFGRDEVIDALIDAHDRGVRVRMVGDAGHLYNSGYKRFRERHIPMVNGNLNHIMHNKFMVVDDRFVFGGTANWTDTDLRHNSNNFFFIDSPEVADDFQAEFQQMYDGLFGHMKVEIDNGRTYQVGDTKVEVWFAPNEDAMVDPRARRRGRRVDSLHDLRLHQGPGGLGLHPQATRVRGEGRRRGDLPRRVHQRASHSGRRDRPVPAALQRAVPRGLPSPGRTDPLRMDSNDNSKQPGDYQAGGGRLHSKTMVLDAYGENPIVITGSFNWSASATQSNDEYLLVFHGSRVAESFDQYFQSLWDTGPHGCRPHVGWS